MFKNLKQKWESEMVETSSLSSDSDPSQAQQFDESSTNNHKHDSNSNLSIVSESDGKRFFKSNGSNTNESILKWMMNKTSSSSQDLTSLSQKTNPTTNLPSLLKPTSRSSVTLNEPSTTAAIDKSASQPSSDGNLLLENTRLREQVKELTRKLEGHLSAAVKNEKPLDQIDDKLLKMVAELMVKESSEDKQQLTKESNNSSKSTSGNWSFLTLPPVNKAEIDDQHKQELDKLQKRINELEETLREKNKTIRLQQQRINDIKKSFQRGSTLDNKLFDLPGNDSESTIDGSPSNNLTPRSRNGFPEKQIMIQPNNHSNHHLHHQRQLSDSQSSPTCPMNDISWQYLRSVIFKFVLTSDYEAQKHLVKVIAMILQFSDAEEKQIKDSLKQKVSWFKNLPLLGNGNQIKNHHSNLNHH